MKKGVVICLCVALIAAVYGSGYAPLAACLSTITYPIILLQHTIYTYVPQLSCMPSQPQDLQVQKLTDHITYLSKENRALQAQLDYATDIRELAQFKKRYEAPGRTAQVLVRRLDEQEHFFLVSGGYVHGIKEDMVAVYDNALVGRVVAVYPWYCKVQLVTDSRSQVAVYCSATRGHAVYKGANSQKEAQLKYVSHLDEVRSADTVFSSGEGLVFPRGFLLGTVTSSHVEGLYHNVHIQPALDMLSVRYCVLLSKSECGD